MKDRINIEALVAEIKTHEFYIRAWRRYTRELESRRARGLNTDDLQVPPKVKPPYISCDPSYATLLYTLRSQARTNPRIHRKDWDLAQQIDYLMKNRSRWEHLIEKPETQPVEVAA